AMVSLRRARQKTAARKKSVSTRRVSVSRFGKFIRRFSSLRDTDCKAKDIWICGLLPATCRRATPSSRLGDQVVIRVADDFNKGKFTRRLLPAHINAAINVRRVRFAAGDEITSRVEGRTSSAGFANQAVFPGKHVGVAEFVRAGFLLDQNFNGPADKRCANPSGDLELFSHRLIPAPSFYAVRNLVVHFRRAGSCLLRVSEHPQPLELRFADELEQRLEASSGFAGKPDDEGGADRDARNVRADFADQI